MNYKIIPEELISDIIDQNVVIIIGNIPGQSFPGKKTGVSEADIAGHLSRESNYSGLQGYFAEVTEYFEWKKSRNALIQSILELLDQPEIPNQIHHIVASLPIFKIVSTDLSLNLDRAIIQAGRRYIKVIDEEDVSFITPHVPIIIKLFGDISQKESLFLTSQDRLRRVREDRLVVKIIQGWIASHRILFISPDFRDAGLRHLFAPIFAIQGSLRRRSYVIFDDPKVSIDSFWLENDVNVIDINPIDFLKTLVETIDSYPENEKRIPKIEGFSSERLLQVFLCHSSEDKPQVRELYRRLLHQGIIPWIDEEDILPGKNWEIEIKKAIRDCDVVIVCLSNNSINKRGFIQKEIKYALDVADEIPSDDIFIIPARMENCQVPNNLKSWQWVNLFEDNGFQKLMKSLKARIKELDQRPTPRGV